MSRRILSATLALMGWLLFAPSGWTIAVYGQTTVLNTTGAITTSSPMCTVSPRNNGSYRMETHTVSLVSGNQYTIDLTSTATASGSWQADLDTYMYLLAPNGSVIESNDDVILGGGSGGTELRSRILHNATVDGVHTIVCTTWAPIGYGGTFDGTYPYTLTATGMAIVGTVTGTLTADPNNPRGSNYKSGRHSVSMTAGTSYRIDVTGEAGDYDFGVNTVVYLLDPSGAVIGTNDDFGNGYSSSLTYAATASGTYTVLVTSFSPNTDFTYNLDITTLGGLATSGPVNTLTTNPNGIPNVQLAPRPRIFATPSFPVRYDV